MELKTVKIEVPKECNVVLGMAHFIKTVEDLNDDFNVSLSRPPI